MNAYDLLSHDMISTLYIDAFSFSYILVVTWTLLGMFNVTAKTCLYSKDAYRPRMRRSFLNDPKIFSIFHQHAGWLLLHGPLISKSFLQRQ